MRLLIVSNRLPINIKEENDKFIIQRSSGGLATGLSSLDLEIERFWIGWPGIFPENEEKEKEISEILIKDNIIPVYLTNDHIENYYEGYSNSTLWPLCHYFFVYTQFQKKFWDSYVEVNNQFLNVVLNIAKEDDLIWVHDYQLLLLPNMIRNKLPNCTIGYFHHIPFPSNELFRILPERNDLLMGVLGSDLIGFHTYDYLRHFNIAIQKNLGIECTLNNIPIANRNINSNVFPMGINFDLYFNSSENKEVHDLVESYTSLFKKRKIILSVDRLDYSKGIINRISAFSLFLENHPEYIEKVSLVVVLVPSRDNVEKYIDLKVQIDQYIGSINGKYSQMDWSPIYYFYKNLPFNELVALYNISDVALVTPLRDGMNLVAKEYVATKKNKKGVLVLSEMAGAATELVDAVIVNPNNILEIEKAISESLEMNEDEQIDRIDKMQEVLKNQTIQKWANDFINDLLFIKNKKKEKINKIIHLKDFQQIKQKFTDAKRRLLLLDYDGTLVSFNKNPKKSFPDNNLKNLLLTLSQKPMTDIAIISGRDMVTLEKWLGDLPIQLIAEHGAYNKEKGIWIKNFNNSNSWKDEIYPIMENISKKTPGSLIEIKESALVWHYRKTDILLANYQVNQLMEMLVYPCSKLNLQIMKGNKIIEVKVSGVNKGISVKNIIENKKYDFILCAGDDTTDEDMFKELPKNSFSIKIGQFSENANYNILDSHKFIKLLTSFI